MNSFWVRTINNWNSLPYNDIVNSKQYFVLKQCVTDKYNTHEIYYSYNKLTDSYTYI